MWMPAVPPIAFSIVRREIALAEWRATEASAEAAKYRRAIEVAIDLLRAEPKDGASIRIDRAAVGLRLALVV